MRFTILTLVLILFGTVMLTVGSGLIIPAWKEPGVAGGGFIILAISFFLLWLVQRERREELSRKCLRQ